MLLQCNMRKILFFVLLLALLPQIRVQGQGMSGPWKGKLKAGTQELTMALHIDEGKKSVTMDIIEQGAVGLEMQVKTLTDDSLVVSIPKLMLTFSGKRTGDKIKGTFVQRLQPLDVEMERGEVTFNRPQEPVPPFPYQTEEVFFDNPSANVTLAGTLTYPVGYKKRKHPPVVLMVTGSGAENRDEEIFYHKPFLVIADWLARHGIASLRYDDRGFAKSTGVFNGATTQDFSGDAEAGIRYLRSLGKFSKVGLLGHSEGGGIGYMLAAEDAIDFLVSLSGPACKIDTLMMVQLNLISRSQGAARDICKTPEDASNYLKATSPGNKWMEYFIAMDLRPYVAKTHCPVLALGAENDLNVPPSVNNEALERCLPKNPKNVIKVYPGLSHLFHHSPTGNPILAPHIEETISPEVLQDISEWILLVAED